MAYAALKKYVDQANRWGAIFGKPAMTWPLTQQSVDRLADRIASELSPENLTCDGELSATEVRARKRQLDAALTDLNEYADQYGMTVPEIYY